MEPTSALIGTFVGYLAKYLKERKNFKEFIGEFTDATISWIKPLFLKEDNEPTKEIEDLQKNPDDDLNKADVTTKLAKFFRDNPSNLPLLEDALNQLHEKDSGMARKVVTQYHYGQGDNIAGDKIAGDKIVDNGQRNKKYTSEK